MTVPVPIKISPSDWRSVPGIRRFSHKAMATIFEIFIVHSDPTLAEQAAFAAFRKLDSLEAELSRFIENSDISQINSLGPYQSLVLNLDTFQCLQLCFDLYHQTNGAFDISIGSFIDRALNRADASTEISDRATPDDLFLDPDSQTVSLLADKPVSLDLGAFGKGFALDKMAEILDEWDIHIAILHGGFSSVLALDPPENMPGWPVTISSPTPPHQTLGILHLNRCALGASGLQKGPHIVDPRTGSTVSHTLAAWVSVTDAASADAISTAGMVMSQAELEAFCCDFPDIAAAVLPAGSISLRWFGPWEKLKADAT